MSCKDVHVICEDYRDSDLYTAFRQKIKKFHPDKNKDENAEEISKSLNAAKDRLESKNYVLKDIMCNKVCNEQPPPKAKTKPTEPKQSQPEARTRPTEPKQSQPEARTRPKEPKQPPPNERTRPAHPAQPPNAPPRAPKNPSTMNWPAESKANAIIKATLIFLHENSDEILEYVGNNDGSARLINGRNVSREDIENVVKLCDDIMDDTTIPREYIQDCKNLRVRDENAKLRNRNNEPTPMDID